MDLFGLPIGDGVGGFVTEMLGFLEILIWIAPLAAIGLFAVYIIKFKYEVDVVHLTGGKKVVVRDKAKKVKDKNGVYKLYLKKTKERIALPPDEVCETTNKGKIHFGVYRTQEGQYVWRKDHGLMDKNGNFRVELPEGAIKDDFKPLNTMNRSFYADEWEEAQKYKTNNVWDTIQKVAPMIGLVIIAVMLMVYWGDLTGPVQEVQQEQTAQLKIQQDITEKNSRMLSMLVNQYVPDNADLGMKNTSDTNG